MSIELKNVTYRYNRNGAEDTPALKDVNLTVEPGQICGIVGHTGSGKTTLVQQLNGLLTPQEGTVTVDGEDFSSRDRRAELRRKVGLVFQYPEYQLFEETVAEDIAFGPRNMGLAEDEIRERSAEAARMTGLDLELLGDRSPFELSGGQKRKAAIAGVLAMRPAYLVLDEPAAGLDPEAHREMLDMLVRICSEWGCGIVLVSHNMDDVAAICHRVYVMEKGSIVMGGTPDQVFSRSGELREMGLGLPAAAELTVLLRKEGVLPDAPRIPLNAEEAAELIAARLRLKGQGEK
ncbi:MAG: energy-coupling factor transporter ATPase [Clostridia bacterium]|nr:energy-coupling factor transporter ATPase [Clostridia bacterium]